MFLSSYSDVFSIRHEADAPEEILPGDIVRSGPNLYPHFEVIAVSGDTVWVRNIQNGADHLAPRARCRKVAGAQEMRLAAE